MYPNIYSASRLAQQIYDERVQAASERPLYAWEKDQGADRRRARPANRMATGWPGLLTRIMAHRRPAWLRS